MSNSREEPILKEVVKVQMYNPHTDEERPIKRANFEGISDIFEHDRVEELRDEGWFTRGIGAKVAYKGRVYKITVAGNSRIGYVKIEDVEDTERGRELHEIVRNKYLKHFRIYSEVRDIE
jgi:hypothetical protein